MSRLVNFLQDQRRQVMNEFELDDLEYDIWEDLEDLVYENCNKNTLNFDEYKTKYGVDLLRENLDIKGILKCVTLLNKENLDDTE
tara:strand:- start:215 stop:469 length:255 start_codon:yes stop_codon:yes gene_type:complete